MPGLVRGKNTPRDSPCEVHSAPSGRSIVCRNKSRYYFSSKDSKFSRLRSRNSATRSGLGRKENGQNNWRMPSEFDQSREVVDESAANHFSLTANGSSNTVPALKVLVTSSDANSNMAVLIDPSAGSSVDGHVSSYSTDSEDLDDSCSSADSSGAATSLSPASFSSLGSPSAREKTPISDTTGNQYLDFSQGSKAAPIFEESQKSEENANELNTKKSSEEDQENISSPDEEKSLNLDSVTDNMCNVYDNTPAGELDENDNCEKPLPHILSQGNTPVSTLHVMNMEQLDNRTSSCDKNSSSKGDTLLKTTYIYASSNAPRKASLKLSKSEGHEASRGQTVTKVAKSATVASSFSGGPRIINVEDRQVQLSKTASKTKEQSENRSRNSEVQLNKPINSVTNELPAREENINDSSGRIALDLSQTPSHSGDNEPSAASLGNNQRQRSLGPEPLNGTDSAAVGDGSNPSGADTLTVDINSISLQRSQSYPQVTPKQLFMPIRLSPEQSGLFCDDQRDEEDLQQGTEENPVTSAPEAISTTTLLTSSISESVVVTTTTATGTTVTTTGSSPNEKTSQSDANSECDNKRNKRNQKVPQSNLPVARVNPQANPNAGAPSAATPAHQASPQQPATDSPPKTPQYPFYQPYPIHQQQQHAFYPTPQLYPVPPGLYMHDPVAGGAGYLAHSPFPAMYLPETPSLCDQTYFQDPAHINYQPYIPPQVCLKTAPSFCLSAEGQNASGGAYRLGGEADKTFNSVGSNHNRNLKGSGSKVEGANVNTSDNKAPSPQTTSDPKANSSVSDRSDHRGSSRNNSSNTKRKTHKQPLLPDPYIPKLSDRVAQVSSTDSTPPSMVQGGLDIQPGVFQPQQHQYLPQHPCQPHQMLQPHHPFFVQHMGGNGPNPPVFQGNFYEHIGPSGALSAHHSVNGVLMATPPPGAGLHLPGHVSSGQSERPPPAASNNDALSSTSPALESASATVGFVTDSSGLVIYGPQPPAAHSPALCLPLISPGSLPRPNTAPIVNPGVECHPQQQQPPPPPPPPPHHPQHLVPSEVEDQHQTGGVTNVTVPSGEGEDTSQQLPVQSRLVYIPDPSGGGYVAMDFSVLQAQMEALGGYSSLPGNQGVPAQDRSYRTPDPQGIPEDIAKNPFMNSAIHRFSAVLGLDSDRDDVGNDDDNDDDDDDESGGGSSGCGSDAYFISNCNSHDV
ncbi:hypothetical protein PoB_007540700 [Plakobranchus ocellatus]|uniref:Uncharacterized protein n=1 Tax=Plakobranchus ocellatus TaxID=259542 RepID=A0AAV4DX64_9GAST|nr:hypothetical protein PoB_007540700 [Plakobranchus ocellatus]